MKLRTCSRGRLREAGGQTPSITAVPGVVLQPAAVGGHEEGLSSEGEGCREPGCVGLGCSRPVSLDATLSSLLLAVLRVLVLATAYLGTSVSWPGPILPVASL